MSKKEKSEAPLVLVRKEVKNLLRLCDVKEFPTPIDDLIESSKLGCESYDLEEAGFLKKIGKKLKEKALKAFEKIRAFLNVRERQILIDKGIHYAKKPFAKLHELGHFRIKWHRDILYVCSELDLDFKTRIEMEKEANVFAAEAIFQGEKFAKMSAQFPLHMNTVIKLSSLCGGSIESTARRFVEISNHNCALAVLRPVPSPAEFGETALEPIYHIYSESFLKKFGRIKLMNHFPSDHPISRIVNEASFEDVLEIEGLINKKLVKIQTFHNGYRVFALIIGGKNK